MKINELNYTPNFGARVKIQKKAFQNIAKDVVDTAKSGGRSLATTASGAAEVTSFPADSASNHSLINVMSKNRNKIGENLEAISDRNIRTSQFENPDVSADSALSSAGTSTIGSGIGAYYGSAASALDQSVNYPNVLYPRSAYDYLAKLGNGSAEEYLHNAEFSAYNHIYDERGVGNESASLFSTNLSVSGILSQYAGSSLLNGKKGLEILDRKIPS